MLKKLKKLLICNLDLLIFAIAIVLKSVLYESQVDSAYYLFMPQLLFSVFSCIIIIIAISLLFKERKRITFLFIVDLIIGIILLADTVYFRYFRDIISIPVIRNGLMAGAVQSSIWSLIKLRDILYLLDIIIFIPLLIKFKHFKPNNIRLKNRLILFIIFIAIGSLFDGYNIEVLDKAQTNLLKTMFNRVYVAKEIGVINYHCIDIYNLVVSAIFKNQPIPKEEITSIKSYLDNNKSLLDSGTVLKSSAKGKNVIIIQVEALQQFVINQKINGVEITPNLNKWASRSAYFDNYFYQVSAGGTSDAELMTNNSLYPAPSGAAYYLYSSNYYNSLPRILGTSGYSNGVFHGYMESFWNRNVMYKAQDFSKFYSDRDYNVNEVVGMGLSDKSFLTQTAEKLKTLQSPYYSFIITLSSHFPFDDIKGYGNFNVAGYDNTLLGNYLRGIHYTDTQLGMFLDKLESDGALKDSIVVLYGDHNAISKDKQDDLAKFVNTGDMTDLKWLELQKVPLMIHFPDDANKGVNHTYGGQVDLLPTLLNLLDLSSNYTFGKDLFNTTKNTVIFRNGTFTDGKSFYVSQTDSYYDIKTEQKVPQDATLSQEKTDAITALQYSDEILQHNLIKSFENK